MTLTTSEMQVRVRRQLSMPSRIGHVALLTASASVGTVVASLLATEPALPARTWWAFAGIVLIAAAWAAYAAWVLTRRRVLFGRQRVAAAWMACLFATAGAAGAIVLVEHVGILAVITSGVLVAAALALLVAARRHVARLDALARDMERAGGTR